MQRGDMTHVWLIRYSDGTLACSSKEYDEAVRIAEEHIKGYGSDLYDYRIVGGIWNSTRYLISQMRLLG